MEPGLLVVLLPSLVEGNCLVVVVRLESQHQMVAQDKETQHFVEARRSEVVALEEGRLGNLQVETCLVVVVPGSLEASGIQEGEGWM